MWFRLLSSLVVFSLITACGPIIPHKKKRPSSAPPPPPAPAAPAQAEPKRGGPFITVTFGNSRPQNSECSTKDDKSLGQDRKIQRKTIDVKMEKQRVIRKNCQGVVTSDGMEKVTFPYTEIILTPVKTWSGLGGSPVSAHNRTTCTGPGAEWESLIAKLFLFGWVTDTVDGLKNLAGFPRMRFSVDTSPTNSSMHVKKNKDNYIDYEFAYCAEKEKDERGATTGVCKKIQTVEKGTLILTVNYTENLDVGGVKEVNENCPAPSAMEQRAN